MNIDTGEVRELAELSEEELRSGKWLKLPKAYEKKVPLTPEDHANVLAAHQRMLRKAEFRARQMGLSATPPELSAAFDAALRPSVVPDAETGANNG